MYNLILFLTGVLVGRGHGRSQKNDFFKPDLAREERLEGLGDEGWHPDCEAERRKRGLGGP